MYSSELFQIPRASADTVPESPEINDRSARASQESNISGVSWFDETKNHGEFDGLYENYSQWFKNDTSLYHGSEMNIAGCSYKVDNVYNKRLNDDLNTGALSVYLEDRSWSS